MSLTSEQLNSLAIITKVTAPLGFMGAMGIFYMRFYHTPQTFKNPTGRLLIAIAFADLLDSIVKFIGRWGPNAGVNSPLCQAQAALIQEAIISSVILGAMMGANALLIVFKGAGSLQLIRKYEKLTIAIGFLFPLPFALYPLIAVNSETGLPFYGDADQWCWFAKSSAKYGIYLWFIPLWIIFVFNLVALILVYRYFKKSLPHAIEMGTVRKDSAEKDQRARIAASSAVIQRLMAYMVAFVFVWAPSTINRITQFAIGSPVFALSVLQSFISPMRGLINFMAFLYAWVYASQYPQGSQNSANASRSRKSSAEQLGRRGESSDMISKRQQSGENLGKTFDSRAQILQDSSLHLS